MKKILLTTLTLIAAINFSYSQFCAITVSPLDTTICPGDSVFIFANANLLGNGQYFDFNNGTLPPGWSIVGDTNFTSPCLPSPSGTPYYWAATAGSGTPGITTSEFDISCGGEITFDMVYAIQGGAAPCEGPDLANEGVELQYSLDGGLTWISIIYYSPGGYTLATNPNTGNGIGVTGAGTPYTVWNTFTVPIPPGAVGTNTMFQWIQEFSSGTCCDNWGIENIIINASGAPCGSAIVDWSNGYQDTTSFYATTFTDTTFIAFVYDSLGNLQCQSDTIFISVYTNNLSFTLADYAYAYCPNDSALAEVLNITGGPSPYEFDWSNGDTINPTYLNANGVEPDSILFYVNVTDACGFMANDSITLVVDQILTIDSLTTLPQINCAPVGSAQAYVSGTTGAVNYSWTGPGNPGPNNSATTSIIDIPTGWYYFTVTDAVCSATDSIFVDSIAIAMTWDLDDFVYSYCADSTTMVEVLNFQNASAPVVIEWSTGNIANPETLPASGTEQDSIMYTVMMTDFCNYVYYDTVILVVNQSLQIDALTSLPQSDCIANGSALATVSGATGTEIDFWTGPGNPGVNNANSLSITNIPTGWYYFTVTDDVCQENDSVFVDILNPPFASFTASQVSGCVPVSVLFTNNSQNSTTYDWDFGNGNENLGVNNASQNQTYTVSSTVTLTAYDAAGCSDMSVINITVIPCGCTDQLALNYNPLATEEDGTCIYPDPIVVVPNVFTPNMDFDNNYFYLTTSNTVAIELTILNRWGNEMFYNYTDLLTNPLGPELIGWNGLTPSGAMAGEGTYFYKYTVTGMDGITQKDGHGFLQLVRD